MLNTFYLKINIDYLNKILSNFNLFNCSKLSKVSKLTVHNCTVTTLLLLAFYFFFKKNFVKSG